MDELDDNVLQNSPFDENFDTRSLLLLNFTTLNFNGTDGGMDLLMKYVENRAVSASVFYTFIFAYGVLIIFGAIGNSLVVSAVVRKSTMRTTRNIFIINLAVSDLLLCVVTMPLTLMEILTTYWPLGRHLFLCKLIGCLQAISIFVSTISITAIALDRYHVIVYPTRASVQHMEAVLALGVIWLLSCALAAPLFIWKTIKHWEMNFPVYGLTRINFCYEEWPTEHGRAYYSIFTIIIQYVVPITVVSVAYARICRKLRYRMKPGMRRSTGGGAEVGVDHGGCGNKDNSRVRRTNTLLISIALIFGISWMPLNVYNVIVDLYDPFQNETNDREKERILYSICHMAGMSSACSNPILYGWLNENFRKEFKDIWLSSKICYCSTAAPDRQGSVGCVTRRSLEQTAVQYKKSKHSPGDAELEQSTLITQVLDRQK